MSEPQTTPSSLDVLNRFAKWAMKQTPEYIEWIMRPQRKFKCEQCGYISTEDRFDHVCDY